MANSYNIDERLEQADWIKQSWDLPEYKSEEFMDLLSFSDMSLEEFRQLPLYKRMVEQGKIVDDEWVGD